MARSKNYKIKICSDGAHLMVFDWERRRSPVRSSTSPHSEASSVPASAPHKSETSSLPALTPSQSAASSPSRLLSAAAPAFIPASKQESAEALASDQSTTAVDGQPQSADNESPVNQPDWGYFEFLSSGGMFWVQHGIWTFIPYPSVTVANEHNGTVFYHTAQPYPFAAAPEPADNRHFRFWGEHQRGFTEREGELVAVSTAGRVRIQLENGTEKEIEPADLGPVDVEYLRDNATALQWALVSKAGVVLEDHDAVSKRLNCMWTLETSAQSMEELGGPMEDEDEDEEVDEELRLLWEECEQGLEEMWF